jgi:uncharacterized paraquat-inducible protein A
MKTWIHGWLKKAIRIAPRALPVVVVLLVLASPLFAQAPKPASTAKGLDSAKPVMEWLAGTIFLVACLVVAFKNAKRANVQ